MVRRATIILLLCILALEAGGALVGLHLRQWVHKAAVAVIIDHGELPMEIIPVTLLRSEFDRIKVHEREFRFQGQMFDVVWRETNGDTLHLYCYRDNAEEKLIAKILGYIARTTDDNRDRTAPSNQTVPAGFTLTAPENLTFGTDIPSLHIMLYNVSMFPIDRSSKTETPPPRPNAVRV